MKKILILHTSVGLGHKSMAENIGFYLSQAGYEVKIADIGKVQHGRFEKYVTAVHQFVNRYLPFVWGWLYNWGHYIIYPFRTFIAGFNYKLTKRFIDEFQPDLIITTQTTSSAVINYLKHKGLYKNKFGIAFSDYHLHPYYLYDRADFYLANIEGQKTEMVKKEISAEKIFVCGITLKPKISVDTEDAKKRLGILNNENVVLIGTGSLGIGFDLSDLKKLSALENTKIIFVCGKNEELLDQIKNIGYKNVIPLPFYKPMDELYAIADIFVGKPGGLSTAEALAWDLPLLITFTLPGQEVKNLDYLVHNKLVLPPAKNLFEAVSSELHSHNFKQQLSQNPKKSEIIGSGQQVLAAVKTAIG